MQTQYNCSSCLSSFRLCCCCFRFRFECFLLAVVWWFVVGEEVFPLPELLEEVFNDPRRNQWTHYHWLCLCHRESEDHCNVAPSLRNATPVVSSNPTGVKHQISQKRLSRCHSRAKTNVVSALALKDVANRRRSRIFTRGNYRNSDNHCCTRTPSKTKQTNLKTQTTTTRMEKKKTIEIENKMQTLQEKYHLHTDYYIRILIRR